MSLEDPSIEDLQKRLGVFVRLRADALNQKLSELALSYGSSIVKITQEIEAKKLK